MARRIVSLLALLALSTPAGAGARFSPPAGCEVYATIQMRGCQVSNHYRCAADAPGDQWAIYLDGNGPFFLNRIDAETRWIISHDLVTGAAERLSKEIDPASFTTLIETGRDDYDFQTETTAGVTRRYVGFDRLTGESVTIGGVTFERTEFDLTARDADGNLLWHRRGRQLIQRDWRLFLADQETFETPLGGADLIVSTPVTIALPGEDGFLAAEPIHECNMLMTRAAPPAGGARVLQ
ncbi:hypothetical protein LV82_00408 [Albidovulum inexpectatum]|uniref:Uncharacterized protein n=1 Tax=Albidovulum inexpectatum TaxID=196587 RepID=A0A2S5JLV9_9RHOB|nr:hypothetical protein [Albidovulum inexpectatum]PPB82474.1 hypothetical protein LV82_00408 [Albidovulum inexpectatum]